MGRHLARRMAKGHDVTVLDSSPDFSMEKEGMRVVAGDILDENVWRGLSAEGFDVIIHLAAKISVLESMRYPERFMAVNVEGTRNAVEMAREWDAELVFFSSAAVYGNYDRPVREDDELKPISPYGKSKAMAEGIAGKYDKSLIFRPANIYGNGKRHKGVVEIFVERAAKGLPITVRGGKQVRDFIHVKDVVDAVAGMIGIHGTFNLGTGRGTSINELAGMVAEMFGVETVHEPMPEGELEYSVLDISRLSKHFMPRIRIGEGIRMVVEGVGAGRMNSGVMDGKGSDDAGG